jgi:putative RNA 2'-phosphotransferase
MTHPALIERITRSLAYMLRHQPEQFDLELDELGYAEVDEVVRALNERLGEDVEEDDVHDAVGSGDRQRYEIVGGRIRALYGHSIDVQPGEPSKPPELLYVGISSADAARAERNGLRPGRRRFLHLALTEDEALESVRRIAREYVLVTVEAMAAWEEGSNFYDRKAL